MTNGQLEAELLLYKGHCVYIIGRKMNFGQRANIKFCLKLGKTFTGRFELMKQVYGDNCLFRARVHEWFKRFKEFILYRLNYLKLMKNNLKTTYLSILLTLFQNH